MDNETSIETQQRLQEIHDRAAEETARIEGHKVIYRGKEPYPEPVILSFSKKFGLQGRVLLLTGLGALVFSALTTLSIFYLADKALVTSFAKDSVIVASDQVLNWTGILRSLAATVAFEGVLVAGGFIKGRTSRAGVAMWIAMGVIVLAGLIYSFGLAASVATDLSVRSILIWLFAILSGGGAAFILFFTSDRWGALLTEWDDLQREEEERYRIEEDAWNTRALADYAVSRSSTFRGTFEKARPRVKAEEQKEPEMPDDLEKTWKGTSLAGWLRSFMADMSLGPEQIGANTEWPPSKILRYLGIPDTPNRQNAMRQAVFAVKEGAK